MTGEFSVLLFFKKKHFAPFSLDSLEYLFEIILALSVGLLAFLKRILSQVVPCSAIVFSVTGEYKGVI